MLWQRLMRMLKLLWGSNLEHHKHHEHHEESSQQERLEKLFMLRMLDSQRLILKELKEILDRLPEHGKPTKMELHFGEPENKEP